MEGGTASTDVMEAPEWVECYSVEEEGAEKLWKLLPTEQQHGELLRAVKTLKSTSTQPSTPPSDALPTATAIAAVPTTTSIAAPTTSAPSDAPPKAKHRPDHDSPKTAPGSSSAPSPSVATTDQKPATFFQALKALTGVYNREDLEGLLKDEKGKSLGDTRLVHFIDTGGQAIYHDVHPVLITSPSVYLVVFSLKDFYDKSTEGKLDYFRSELIQRPLRSIYTFGTKKTEDKDHLELQPHAPKIFIVGTHLDQVPGKIQEKFLLKLHEMVSIEIGTKPYRQFVQYDPCGRSFWAVDNTLAGKEQDEDVKKYISTLRMMVQDISMEMSVKVPLPWMLLKLVMDGKGVPYCKYSKLLEVACERGYVREDSPKADLDAMLRLFHILGLLYHKVPSGYKKENSLVFIDPDCLYSTTSYFLMAAKEEIGDPKDPESQHQTQAAEEGMHHKENSTKAEIREQRQEANGIVQQQGVIQRVQANVESIRQETEALLKKVEELMANLGQEPTDVALGTLHAELKATGHKYMTATKKSQDAACLSDKRQLFLGRLAYSLANAVGSVLHDSRRKGDMQHIKQEVDKAVKNVLARCQTRSVDSNDMEQFLSILSGLRILAKLKHSDTCIVPAALPQLLQPVEIPGSADPILITVVSQAVMRVCYLPSGLFCCLISELVSELGWSMNPLGRTHIVFNHDELAGKVHVIEHESYIEIKMESMAPLQDLAQTCQNVRRSIHERIVHVYAELYSGLTTGTKCKESLVWGFQCEVHPSEKTHLAAFQQDDFECCAKCLIPPFSMQEVPPEQLLWFSSELDLD